MSIQYTSALGTERPCWFGEFFRPETDRSGHASRATTAKHTEWTRDLEWSPRRFLDG